MTFTEKNIYDYAEEIGIKNNMPFNTVINHLIAAMAKHNYDLKETISILKELTDVVSNHFVSIKEELDKKKD